MKTDNKIKLDSKISLKRIDDEDVLVHKDKRLVLPTKEMQSCFIH